MLHWAECWLCTAELQYGGLTLRITLTKRFWWRLWFAYSIVILVLPTPIVQSPDFDWLRFTWKTWLSNGISIISEGSLMFIPLDLSILLISLLVLGTLTRTCSRRSFTWSTRTSIQHAANQARLHAKILPQPTPSQPFHHPKTCFPYPLNTTH